MNDVDVKGQPDVGTQLRLVLFAVICADPANSANI